MNIWYLSWANLKWRPLNTVLGVLLIALGTAVLTSVITFEQETRNKLEHNSGRIDMVVGAKGSPLQLVLANIYHIDNPTGNIPLGAATLLQKSPLVKESLKLAYGDYFNHYRILGTDPHFLRFYGVTLAKGRVWTAPLEVVAGAEVARKNKLKLGSVFSGTHGAPDGEEHQVSYRVCGILARSGTVADHLVLTSLQTVWDTHHAQPGSPNEITAVLIRFKSNLGLLQLPVMINKIPNLQAALPGIETSRLLDLLGVGFTAVKAIAGLLLLVSAITIFITMLNTLKERKYELALMRVLGAPPHTLVRLILLEAAYLSLIGWTAGLLLSRVALLALGEQLQHTYHYHYDVLVLTKTDLLVLLLTLLLGLLASLVPAVRTYNIPIAKTLMND